jgi:hypothetical protein
MMIGLISIPGPVFKRLVDASVMLRRGDERDTWEMRMERRGSDAALAGLEPLIGEWRMVPDFEGAGDGAPVTFEWLPGQRFAIQRWEIPGLDPQAMPAAGVAVIGAGPDGGLVQHYFDSRGVERVYGMTIGDGVWMLWRDAPDDFSQRFTGTFSADGETIAGAWELCRDGTTWAHDFDLTYRRVGAG